ncbi:CHD3-type chromatin-remodeling factor PICKLE isoform X1 [Cryptomeria japonica]|uniref:CHD3-type chromatin-remodeling factor PICKLE isoform X1 n=1 Tax=Cryptomeria japonica TaxID=3369 RepID=UPI0027DA597D|nr:CHD3-type chromatin-remodeling factor PICKLE isoform X1 [Cryptomeria japonica]XP_059076149.1 CHD3-type chromatin-remodeling factor PICKLE isoform X1 [Cryptomeria japonica]
MEASDGALILAGDKENENEDSCHVCGGSGSLLCCDECTGAYHLQCLKPPLTVVPHGSWSCPKCVTPLADLDKILDCQMRTLITEDNGVSTQKLEKHYLVKFKSRSYLHCSWISQEDFERAFKSYPQLKTRLNNFHRQLDSVNASNDDWMPLRSEWVTVDRVINCRMTGNVYEYLIKWKDLPYDMCTWEVEKDISAFQDQINKYNVIQARGQFCMFRACNGPVLDSREAKCKIKDFKPYDHTPKFLVGGTLHPYQLEGLNFLRFSWLQGRHVILADEMGLGKTIQSISFLASLAAETVCLPHLVVAPLSTLRNWEREFYTWAPDMNAVMYTGNAQARSVIRKHEFFFPKKLNLVNIHKGEGNPVIELKKSKQERIKFDVLLTSYEMITIDAVILKNIKWECLIVDEGHRLKNKDSKLFQTLKHFSSNHRVLLTGTPLQQNNLDELFVLMHFLDAGKFASSEDFHDEFKDISHEEQVGKLHQMLAPHLLRRLKKDVMQNIPPKKELILRVELSPLQKEYYKAILTRNYHILARRGRSQISLNNVVMELRKLCGHPYMLGGVEPDVKDVQEAYRKLLEASGKLLLLDKMMAKLKIQGHRVLLYSQFHHMLDILEDYLSYKKWTYERIDGKVNGVERQIRIDRFNAPNSTRFCFLLSTRAGGLGINLATADTVILYDSDWNPHADFQAMARAHRLGQMSKVMIYRLITRGTVEERMMQMTKKKMILEHLVVGRLKAKVLNQETLDDILRHGAKDLFFDENGEAGKSRQIYYDDAAIDRLLDRSLVDNEDRGSDEEEKNGFLKAFKVANFEYVDEEKEAAVIAEEMNNQEMDHQSTHICAADKAKYWDDLLKRNDEQQQTQAITVLGKRKHCHKQIICIEEDDLSGLNDNPLDEEVKDNESDWIETDDSSLTRRLPNTTQRRAQALKARGSTVELSLLEGEGNSLRVLGFNQRQRATFLQILMMFGLGDFSWSEFISRMKKKSPQEIKNYATLFLIHIVEGINDLPTFSDGVPKEGLQVQEVLVRLAILSLIKDKVDSLAKAYMVPMFTNDIKCSFPGLKSDRYWKEEHDLKLLRALIKHGYGRWPAILEDVEYGLKHVIQMELQLPVVTSTKMCLPSKYVGVCPAMDIKDPCSKEDAYSPVVEAQVNPPVAGYHCNVNHKEREEAASGLGGKAQINCDGTSLSDKAPGKLKGVQFQNRMTRFLKRRVILLEEALNVEYHKVSNLNAEDQESCKDINGETSSSDTPILCRQSSLLLPIGPEEVLTCAVDNKSNHLEIARLYNELCNVVHENEHDSFQACSGNKSAAYRLGKKLYFLQSLCQDVCRILESNDLQV